MTPQFPGLPSAPQQQPVRFRIPLSKPRLTYVFLAIIIAVFLAEEFTGGSTSSRNLIRWGANYAPLVDAGQYWRLFTANFLHIGFMHIAVNAYSLYILGREVEALFGWRRFLVLYLLTGLSGAVFSYIFTHGLSAGASTALFGLFGALGAYYFRNRQMLGETGQRMLGNLAITLFINIAIGLSPGSGIDNFGHLGGFVGGLALGWFFCPRYAQRDTSGGMYLPGITTLELVDTNSLGKQTLVIAVFVLALIALILFAPTTI